MLFTRRLSLSLSLTLYISLTLYTALSLIPDLQFFPSVSFLPFLLPFFLSIFIYFSLILYPFSPFYIFVLLAFNSSLPLFLCSLILFMFQKFAPNDGFFLFSHRSRFNYRCLALLKQNKKCLAHKVVLAYDLYHDLCCKCEEKVNV